MTVERSYHRPAMHKHRKLHGIEMNVNVDGENAQTAGKESEIEVKDHA